MKGNDFQRVKDLARIDVIVGQFVALNRVRGSREPVGLCPFHNDHKPSFTVNADKGLFKCFSCGAGGDVFTFVQRFLGYTPLESLRFVAHQIGYTLTERHSEARSDGVSSADLRRACSFAEAFYRLVLMHPAQGARGRDALEARGVDEAQRVEYGLGFGPEADVLARTARAKGFPVELLEAAGVVDRGGMDRMSGRVVFPIGDAARKPIAFGGRIVPGGREGDGPKYLNTRETPIYAKSKVVYGLFQARRAIAQSGVAVVVEGYMDVLAARRAGVENAVGFLGTALTEEHVRALSMLAHTIVIVPDQDDAGIKAAMRGVETCVRGGLAVKVAELGMAGCKDLDDAVRAGEGELARSRIANPMDGLAWRFAKALDGVDGGARAVVIEREARAMARAVAALAPVRRRAALEALAAASGMPMDVISEEAKHATQMGAA